MSEYKKRKIHRSEFKAKVGLEAIRGVKTINEIAQVNIGQNTARGKKSKSHRPPMLVKDIWMYPLRKDFASLLCQ